MSRMRTGERESKEATLRRDLAAFQDQMAQLKGDVVPDEAWDIVENAQAMPDPMAKFADMGPGASLPTFIRPRDR